MLRDMQTYLKITCPTCRAKPEQECARSKPHSERIRRAADPRTDMLGDKWWESKPAKLGPISDAIKRFAAERRS